MQTMLHGLFKIGELTTLTHFFGYMDTTLIRRCWDKVKVKKTGILGYLAESLKLIMNIRLQLELCVHQKNHDIC